MFDNRKKSTFWTSSIYLLFVCLSVIRPSARLPVVRSSACCSSVCPLFVRLSVVRPSARCPFICLLLPVVGPAIGPVVRPVGRRLSVRRLSVYPSSNRPSVVYPSVHRLSVHPSSIRLSVRRLSVRPFVRPSIRPLQVGAGRCLSPWAVSASVPAAVVADWPTVGREHGAITDLEPRLQRRAGEWT